ncbi:MAG: S8 family serine peptidase [Tepidiformaceae bacterium]
MRTFSIRASILAAMVMAVAVFAGANQGVAVAQPASDNVPGRYIVVLRDGVDPAGFARARGHQADVVYEFALNGFAGPLSPRDVARLRADPDVRLIEADGIMTAFDIPTGVNRIDAEELLAPNGTADLNIDIAIIDTGIASHSKLRIAGGADFSRNSFLCKSKSSNDGHGHGTHVAGTAAARDTDGPNGTRVVGVAPGARLWAVKVLSDSGSGYTSCVIKGVDWVTANAATIEVANMSLGGGNSAALCTAINNSTAAGVTYAVAAGNSDTDAANTSPANCTASGGVLTTAAIADYDGKGGALFTGTKCANYGPDDSFATFSNFGSVVNIAAPGVCIYSTYKGGGYATMSGTSMASPHAAGAAALFKLANSDATPQAVRDGVILASKPHDSSCGYASDNTDTSTEQSSQTVRALHVGTIGNCN